MFGRRVLTSLVLLSDSVLCLPSSRAVMTATNGGAAVAHNSPSQAPSLRRLGKRKVGGKQGWGSKAMQHQLGQSSKLPTTCSSAVYDFADPRCTTAELSLGVILFILAANALSTPVAHLSTRYTPDPSYHYSYRFARFLFISFRQPGTSLYFKGRE